MAEQLELSSFSEHVNTKFRIRPDDSTVVETELIVAEDLGATPGQERFSLIFRGPQEPYLPQQIYRIDHDQMGTLELFLVPISRDEKGLQYEAVFNRLHDRK